MNRPLISSCCLLTTLAIIVFGSCCETVRCSPGGSDEWQSQSQGRTDEILWDILSECLNGVEPISTCLKLKVLNYFDYNLEPTATPRANHLSTENTERLDKLLIKRFKRYAETHELQLNLPEFLFQGTTLIFKPNKDITDFDIKFPEVNSEAREISSARDMMQQKMLLPMLMMMKMKMKMITPILLMMVSIKATKALIMSKLALTLVLAFLASQLMKKLGMHLPMLSHPMDSAPASPPGPPSFMITNPPPSYGPPVPPSYGPPIAPPSSPPSTSYGEPPSSWEPSGGSGSSSYLRTWDPQQLAYSAYYNSNSNNQNDSPLSSSSNTNGISSSSGSSSIISSSSLH